MFFKNRRKKRGYSKKIPSFFQTKYNTSTKKSTKKRYKYIKKYELSVLFDHIRYE